jgi:hypothetical protein
MSDKIYEELLRLVAIPESEIPALLPDWIQAAERLHLSEQDVEFAVKEWIPENWDITSLGTRMAMGAYMRELIDLTKVVDYKKQGVKIVYGILPAMITNYLAIKKAGGDRVYTCFPDIFLVYSLNGFFHKASPLLDAAEQQGGIVYGCRHCALNKTRIAAAMTGLIPSPDIIWAWGLNCDEATKTDEYINCFLDPEWNVEAMRIPHDTNFGDEDDKNLDRVKYLAAQMEHSFKKVQDTIGIQVSPEHIKSAMNDWGRLAFKLGRLQQIISTSDPVVFDGALLSLCQAVLNIPFNTPMTHIEAAVDMLLKEGVQRQRDGVGVAPKYAPKLGAYFVPNALPWVGKIFKENGVATTFSMVVSLSKRQLQPPSFEDPYMAAAEQWLRMGIGMNMGLEMADTVEKVEMMKPDAMLMGFFDFDRWLGAHQKMMAKLVEERTGVPHFYLESDFWEDRDYSPEALRTRIESISQVLKMRQQQAAMEKVPA